LKRWGAAVASVAALALAATGPAVFAPPSAAADKEKVTFTVGLLNDPDSFNPFVGIEAESFEMWSLMYDSLIGYSMKDMSPAPSLAKSWETSQDGLTWTFDVRSGVTWSDGKPLTARDVAYTYDRILDGGPEKGTWGSYLASVDTVTAPDDTTLVLKLSEPNALMPLLPIPIMPQHIWKDISEEEVKTYPNEPPNVVGSGPFRLLEGKAGGSVVRFEANPDYWQGAPNIDEVVFRIFNAEDPAVQALKIGEIDFLVGLSVSSINALEGVEGIESHLGDSPGFDEIAFNVGSIDLKTGEPLGDPNPAVLDPAFRRAIAHAVDTELIVERVYEGAGTPGTTIVPPAYSMYHWEPPPDQAYTFDLAEAERLLDEAGYRVGDNGMRTLPNGEPMDELRLFGRSDSETSTKVMEYLHEWLTEIEVPSRIETPTGNKLTDIILEGEFDLFEWGWYVEPVLDTMLSYMTCGQLGVWNDSWYCNKEYDRLYEQQQTEMDEAKRAEMIKRMQQILYRDVPYIVTAYSSIGEAWRSDRFTGFKPQPDPGGVYLMQYGVHDYINVEPVSAGGSEGGTTGTAAGPDTSDAGSSGDSGNGLVLGGTVVVAALAAGLVGWLLMRRRQTSTAADRE
jgi:peptide/nickel transport system substrate-binding protein